MAKWAFVGLLAVLLIVASFPQATFAEDVNVDLADFTDDCTTPVHWWDKIECKFEDILDYFEAEIHDFETSISLWTGNLTRQVDLVFDEAKYELKSLNLSASLGSSINLVVAKGTKLFVQNDFHLSFNATISVSGSVSFASLANVAGELILEAESEFKDGLHLAENAVLAFGKNAKATVGGFVNVTGQFLAAAEADIQFHEAQIVAGAKAFFNRTLTFVNSTKFTVEKDVAKVVGFIVQGVNNTIHVVEGAGLIIETDLQIVKNAAINFVGNVTLKAETKIEGALQLGLDFASHISFEAGFYGGLFANLTITAGAEVVFGGAIALEGVLNVVENAVIRVEAGVSNISSLIIHKAKNELHVAEGVLLQLTKNITVVAEGALSLAGNITAHIAADVKGALQVGVADVKAAATFVKFEAGLVLSKASNLTIAAKAEAAILANSVLNGAVKLENGILHVVNSTVTAVNHFEADVASAINILANAHLEFGFSATLSGSITIGGGFFGTDFSAGGSVSFGVTTPGSSNIFHLGGAVSVNVNSSILVNEITEFAGKLETAAGSVFRVAAGIANITGTAIFNAKSTIEVDAKAALHNAGQITSDAIVNLKDWANATFSGSFLGAISAGFNTSVIVEAEGKLALKADTFFHGVVAVLEGGALSIKNGVTTLKNDLESFGTTTVNSILQFENKTANYLQSKGQLILADGAALKAKIITIAKDASLAVENGVNTIEGDVKAAGAAILNAVENFHINGSLSVDISGHIGITLGGAKNFSILSVLGNLEHNGILAINVANGYEPAVGSIFPVIVAGSASGKFSAVDPSEFEAQYQPTGTSVRLTRALPTPTGAPIASPASVLIPTFSVVVLAYILALLL